MLSQPAAKSPHPCLQAATCPGSSAQRCDACGPCGLVISLQPSSAGPGAHFTMISIEHVLAPRERMWRDHPMEHKTPGTGPLRCLSLGRDAGGGQSYTLTPQRVCVAPQPFARASPVYDRLCPRVCCWVERGRSDLCGCKPEPGGGGGFREPGWDGTSWGSLNHIGAAMGRLPGAWRAEREAHASDLSGGQRRSSWTSEPGARTQGKQCDYGTIKTQLFQCKLHAHQQSIKPQSPYP